MSFTMYLLGGREFRAFLSGMSNEMKVVCIAKSLLHELFCMQKTVVYVFMYMKNEM